MEASIWHRNARNGFLNRSSIDAFFCRHHVNQCPTTRTSDGCIQALTLLSVERLGQTPKSRRQNYRGVERLKLLNFDQIWQRDADGSGILESMIRRKVDPFRSVTFDPFQLSIADFLRQRLERRAAPVSEPGKMRAKSIFPARSHP